MNSASTPPIALTIAGSDSGGGAGIQADLKTFSALGVYGASILTALTAQNTREVRAIYDVGAEFIAAQMDCVFDDLPVQAIKIGMLSQTAAIETIAERLADKTEIPLVLDPVMVAKSGDPLLHPQAIDSLRDRLLPMATLITPNLPEAAMLLDIGEPKTRQQMHDAAKALLDMGASGVLIKGGHLPDSDAGHSTDFLLSQATELWLPAKRIDTPNTHGTGCTLSSAITAGLAKGLNLESAVREAKVYITEAISASGQLQIGSGHGPVHHFYRWW